MSTLRVQSGKMLSGATATGASTPGGASSVGRKTFQAIVSGTGAVVADVNIEASMDGTNWEVRVTLNAAGTTTATASATLDEVWPYWRANCTAISGTGATLNVYAAEVVSG